MKNKRIVINASILHERPTGLGIYTKNVIKEMVKIDKSIITFSPVEIEGVKTKKITDLVKPSYKKIGGIMRLLWTQFVLPFKVSKDDILYHPFQYICLFSRSKQVMTVHDFIPMYYPEVAKHQYRYYKYLMPFLIKKAYKIVCISQNTKKDLLKFYNVSEEKIEVIYNGYDENLFNNDKLNKDILKKYNINYKYMLMVGASYPHKNLDIVIKAFKDIEDCKLVVVGKESDYIKRLKLLCKELNIEHKINFVGYVSDKDLKDLYGFSVSFLYPTLYEGFGLPIIEAMACGTTVICSDNSSLPEVSNDAALTFNAKSVSDIKEKIEIMANNIELREELKDKSKENIKRFSWKKTAKSIYSLLT